MTPTTSNWKAIAEQASLEMNPQKLMLLISQLCAEMGADEAKELARLTPHPPQAH